MRQIGLCTFAHSASLSLEKKNRSCIVIIIVSVRSNQRNTIKLVLRLCIWLCFCNMLIFCSFHLHSPFCSFSLVFFILLRVAISCGMHLRLSCFHISLLSTSSSTRLTDRKKEKIYSDDVSSETFFIYYV